MRIAITLLSMLAYPILARSVLAEDSSPASVEVINVQSFWRCHLTWKTEMIRSEAGVLAPIEISKGKPAKVSATTLPPANWADLAFDDGAWVRLQAPIQGSRSRSLSLICLRGKFEVKDPASAGEMDLSLTFRGGVVVYLNGQEIARGNLAGEKGKADLDALADDYPKDAYVTPEGTLFMKEGGEAVTYKDRIALRDRKLAARLPKELLRKGVNVLALELHRAPTHEVLHKGKMQNDPQYYQWTMLEFLGGTLKAPGRAAVVSNVSRPTGFRVWNHSVITTVDPAEYADPNEPVGAVQIVGCRNGAFSGQLAAGSTEVIKGLKAEPSVLKSSGGGEISASLVQIRWPRAIPTVAGMNFGLEAMEVSPPAEVSVVNGAAIQPVFVTVNVPKDAKPGEYTGKVTISASSASADVPLRVKVADWTLPDTNDYRTHAGLVQSPDSPALQYNVPLWSEAHWKLLDQSFTLLSQVGAREVFIPLICETHHGNEQTMVRWTKDGNGYKHDYSIAEKYLDMALKRLGRASAVCLYIWDRQGVGASWGKAGLSEQKNPARVSLLDPATGKVAPMDAPKWGTPQSVPFWKPVFEGMGERLKARGLEQAAMLGVVLDSKPLKATVDDLTVAAPGLKYMMVAHLGWGGPLASWASVWTAKQLSNPEVNRPYEVKNPGYVLRAFPRYGGGSVSVHQAHSPTYRMLMESEYCAGNDGFGWVGADFWPCRKDSRGRAYDLLGGAEVGNLTVPLSDSVTAVLAPGAAGPISTLRLEMLREGTQETQAAVLIAGAINDSVKRSKLGDKLAGRVQELLYDRALAMYWRDIQLWPARPWQAESEMLYALAGEVADKLGNDK